MHTVCLPMCMCMKVGLPLEVWTLSDFIFIWSHGWTPSLPFSHSLLSLSRRSRRLVKRSWRQNKKWNCIPCLQKQTFLLLSTLGTRRETLLEQRYNAYHACMSVCDCQPNRFSLVFWCIFLSLPHLWCMMVLILPSQITATTTVRDVVVKVVTEKALPPSNYALYLVLGDSESQRVLCFSECLLAALCSTGTDCYLCLRPNSFAETLQQYVRDCLCVLRVTLSSYNQFT